MCLRFKSGYSTFFFNDLVSNGDIVQLEKLCELIINSKLCGKLNISGQMRCREEMRLPLLSKLTQRY